jgi:hypothetical protein
MFKVCLKLNVACLNIVRTGPGIEKTKAMEGYEQVYRWLLSATVSFREEAAVAIDRQAQNAEGITVQFQVRSYDYCLYWVY